MRRRRLWAALPVLISISSSARRCAPSASRFFALRVVFAAIGHRCRFAPTLTRDSNQSKLPSEETQLYRTANSYDFIGV
ncbi:hypothetical protein RHECNPAF_4460030 [Rhizobium etli CNPAF512]|nr:hypothetical protein RHECNPAF_4460030 [Rhizobium etli CNPAF512]